MKNKKLVATVASLCLVVVAVVAAVVGVFAAVTQNATATFTVKYTAINAAATITVNGKGPVKAQNANTRTVQSTTADGTETFKGVSATINPTSTTTTATLNFEPLFDFGWSDGLGQASPNAGQFYGYALYEFKIENNSKINAMGISWTGTVGDNLTVQYYRHTSSILDSATVTASWDAMGELVTDGAGALALSAGTDVTGNTMPDLVVSTTTTSTVYIYALVAITNATVFHNNGDSPSTSLTVAFTFVGK